MCAFTSSHIFGSYFDVASDSTGGSFVSGRLNPKANRNWRSSALASWTFALTASANGMFEIVNERDTEGRLFGALRLAQSSSSPGAAGSVHVLAAELREAGTLVDCLSFRVHVVEETALQLMATRVLHYAFQDGGSATEPSSRQLESSLSYIESNAGKLKNVDQDTERVASRGCAL